MSSVVSVSLLLLLSMVWPDFSARPADAVNLLFTIFDARAESAIFVDRFLMVFYCFATSNGAGTR